MMHGSMCMAACALHVHCMCMCIACACALHVHDTIAGSQNGQRDAPAVLGEGVDRDLTHTCTCSREVFMC